MIERSSLRGADRYCTQVLEHMAPRRIAEIYRDDNQEARRVAYFLQAIAAQLSRAMDMEIIQHVALGRSDWMEEFRDHHGDPLEDDDPEEVMQFALAHCLGTHYLEHLLSNDRDTLHEKVGLKSNPHPQLKIIRGLVDGVIRSTELNSIERIGEVGRPLLRTRTGEITMGLQWIMEQVKHRTLEFYLRIFSTDEIVEVTREQAVYNAAARRILESLVDEIPRIQSFVSMIASARNNAVVIRSNLGENWWDDWPVEQEGEEA